MRSNRYSPLAHDTTESNVSINRRAIRAVYARCRPCVEATKVYPSPDLTGSLCAGNAIFVRGMQSLCGECNLCAGNAIFVRGMQSLCGECNLCAGNAIFVRGM